jgi:hypothetical protein
MHHSSVAVVCPAAPFFSRDSAARPTSIVATIAVVVVVVIMRRSMR